MLAGEVGWIQSGSRRQGLLDRVAPTVDFDVMVPDGTRSNAGQRTAYLTGGELDNMPRHMGSDPRAGRWTSYYFHIGTVWQHAR